MTKLAVQISYQMLNYLFNIWILTTLKILSNSKKLPKYVTNFAKY